MDILEKVMGTLRLELTSADIAGMLAAMNHAGITLYQTRQTGDLTFECSIRRADLAKVSKLAQRRGGDLRILRYSGIYWTLSGLKRRPVLILGIAVLLCLVLLLPTRVLFIRVEGNESIPANLILEKARLCGIEFGASRREVRSEKVKNALLEEIPELKWAGINTSGCVATISVKERSSGESTEQAVRVSSIVASRDGVIQSCTVLKGNGLCKVGQAVKAGQVLVSGYTDCGISIQATRAEAEVYAQTRRDLTAVTPEQYTLRGELLRSEKKYGLLIGKKRINFYKDSRILDSSCVKMYTESYLTLPGGFRLPVAIVKEEWLYYDDRSVFASAEEAEYLLRSFAEDYIPAQMIAGQILSGKETLQQADGCFQLHGTYACLEMIGREQNEEIIGNNGKSD